MKTAFATVVCSALIGLWAVSSPALAQQKTAKECRTEWQANKADNQAKGVTEKAYVAQCRGGAAAQPTTTTTAAPAPAPTVAAPGGQKTAKACRAEWQANKAANQSAGITEKAYVDQCRTGATVTPPTSTTSAPTATTPVPTPTSAHPKPAPTAVTTPTGANQFGTEAQAKGRCPSDTVVWANTKSKVYHFSGYKNYGDTKAGAYMCEKDATSQGFRAAKNEKHT